MKVSAFEVYCGEFIGCDRDAGRVAAAVESRADLQSCFGRRVGDEIDDDLVADQWLAAPVLCDVAEHSVFDLVPLAGARREVADVDGQAQLGCQVLQGYLPEPVGAQWELRWALSRTDQYLGQYGCRRADTRRPTFPRGDRPSGCSWNENRQ